MFSGVTVSSSLTFLKGATMSLFLEGVTCICHDTGMCHYFGLLPDFWAPFWAIPGFLGTIFFWKNLISLIIIQIFGY